MYYYGLSSLKIINIWKSDVPDLKHPFDLTQEIKSKFKNEPSKTLDVVNLHYNDFFFSGIMSTIMVRNYIEDIIFL